MTDTGNDQLEREVEAALARIVERAVPDDARTPAPPWQQQRRTVVDPRRFGRATPWLVAAVLLVLAGLGLGASVAYDASAPDRAPVGTTLPSPTATGTDSDSDGTLGDPPTPSTATSGPTLSRDSNVAAPDDGVTASTSTATTTGTRVVGVGTYGPISVGMSQAEAVAALGLTAADVGDGPNSCFRYLPLTGNRTVGPSSGIDDLVVLDTRTDQVVLVTPPSSARDESGLGVGSTLAQLQAAYPDGTLTDSVSGYVFVRSGSGDVGTGYLFDGTHDAPTASSTVTGFYVGTRDYASGSELYCTASS